MQPSWSVGLHQSVRILAPASQWLVNVLECDGLSAEETLARLPYDQSRSRGAISGSPDPRRYRDAREVVQTMGLAYEDVDGAFRVTDLGRATRRWLPQLQVTNAAALGKYAAFGLSACQLINPMRKRVKYDSGVTAKPFLYLWKAMLELEDRISTVEINRALLYALDDDGLQEAIERIRLQRANPAGDFLLPEVESGSRKNDRIIPIVSAGSFGYAFMATKQETGSDFYRIRPECRNIVHSASQANFPSPRFDDTPSYVKYISRVASLPKDLR